MNSTAVTVVKVGGNELSRPGFLVELAVAVGRLSAGGKVVLVHGGGREVDRLLGALGVVPTYHEGQRVTDGPTLAVVEAVLAGNVNGAIVRALVAQGIAALGVAGPSLGILPVEPWAGLGSVGRPHRARRDPLEALLGCCEVLVLAPIGLGDDGGAYNVNADHAAAAVAAALEAPLALVTDVPGVLADGAVVATLDVAAARGLIESGVIYGGMVPKVTAAFDAIERGAAAALIVNLAGLGTGGTRIVPHVAHREERA